MQVWMPWQDILNYSLIWYCILVTYFLNRDSNFRKCYCKKCPRLPFLRLLKNFSWCNVFQQIKITFALQLRKSLNLSIRGAWVGSISWAVLQLLPLVQTKTPSKDESTYVVVYLKIRSTEERTMHVVLTRHILWAEEV